MSHNAGGVVTARQRAVLVPTLRWLFDTWNKKLTNSKIGAMVNSGGEPMIAQVRQNYQITLPAELRKRMGLKIGDLMEIAVKGTRLILTPKRAVDLDQAWFWTKAWQAGEREADADIKAGRVKKAKSAEELIRSLKE